MIMFQILLGHLVGDFLLQNEWMALTKSKNSWEGWLAAIIHCLIYTFTVCLFMQNYDLLWIVIVFNSHFWIDKFALAEKYMHYIKGKGMKDFVMKDKVHYVDKAPIDRYDLLEGGFTAVVYTVTDNTMHLLLMYIAYQILY